MRAPNFWFQNGSFFQVILQPLAWVYSFITHLRWFFVRPQKVSIPVICVGNFVMGGAGKTPTVLLISQLLKAQGHAPHVISRGYGRKTKGIMQVDVTAHTVADVGDEPFLLAHQVPTWVGTDRVACARTAEQAGATVIIMDDGFQSPPLFKDLSLVVVDGHQCLGNGAVFPAGPLREPLERGLKRADAVLTIGPCDIPFETRLLSKPSLFALWGRQKFDSGSSFTSCKLRSLTNFFLPRKQNSRFRKKSTIFPLTIHPKSALPTEPLVAFAGIGYPEKFRKSLLENGGNVVLFVPFPDHHFYSKADLDALLEQARTRGAHLITTSKDFIKLPKDFSAYVKIWEIELVAPPEFEEWLGEKNRAFALVHR